MSLIDNIKNYLGERKLKRTLLNSNRKPEFINFDQVKNVGVIFEATDPEEFEGVKKLVVLLKEKKKIVKAVGFYDNKITPPNLLYSKSEFDLFNLKELTSLREPSSPYIRTFVDGRQDVLIDLNLKNKFPLRTIAIQSNALLKIGIDIPANLNVHELLLKMDPSDGPFKIGQQAIRYLEMINKK
jgi:hypothetical protein